MGRIVITIFISILLAPIISAKEDLKISPDSLFTLMDMGKYDTNTYTRELESLLEFYAENLHENNSYHYIRATTLLAESYAKLGLLQEANSVISACENNNFVNTENKFYLLYPKAVIGLVLGDEVKAYEYIYEYKRELEKRNLINLEYANCLECMALIENSLGENVMAKIYLDVAIEIYNKEVGDIRSTHRRSAVALLTDLALLYCNKQNYLEACKLLEIAYNISTECNFEDMKDLSMTSLITIYHALNEFEKAQSITNDYDDISSNWINSITRLTNLAHLYLDMNNQSEFETNSMKACQLIKAQIKDKVKNFATSEHEDFWYKYSPLLMVESWGGLNRDSSPQYLGQAYDTSLFLKDIDIFSDTRLKRISLNHNEVTPINKKIKTIKHQMMYDKIPWEEWNALNDSIRKLERILIANLDGLSYSNGFETTSWKDIQNKLDLNEAAIEFIRVPLVKGLQLQSFKYGALVVKKQADYPKYVELCEIGALDSIINTNDPYEINSLYSNTYLYDNIWSKLEKEIDDGINTLYVSYTGGLENVNHNFIVNHEGIELCKKFKVYSLTSTNKIERCKNGHSHINNATLFGGIIYNNSDSALISDNNNIGSYKGDIIRAGFKYLPETRKEVELIGRKLSDKNIATKTYKGLDATEEVFKSLSGKQIDIIHVATHGFNLSRENNNDTIFGKAIGYSNEEHLMARTGLLMANALESINDHYSRIDDEDGILTADEISRLDLSGVQIAILSACETGIGYDELSGNIGLQRGFIKAGVNNLILSLWKVPDAPTMMLMDKLYDKLSSGVEIHDALLKAQKEMKKMYPDPYYWASFIILN